MGHLLAQWPIELTPTIFDVLLELATDQPLASPRQQRVLRNKEALVLVVDLLSVADEPVQKHVLRSLVHLLDSADSLARWREACGSGVLLDLLVTLPERLRCG